MTRTLCVKIIIFSLLTFYVSLFFVKKINLTTADLGRHIKNGELVLQDKKVLTTNYYSNTQPEFETINHHWLSGVIYYYVQRVGDFNGISVFNWILWFTAIGVLLITACSRVSISAATLALLLVVPMIATRTEIRPEVYSYLFSATYILVFERLLAVKSTNRLYQFLAILIPIQILWVNLHIFFVYGILISGTYFLQTLALKENKAKHLAIITAILVVVSSINPQGIKGLAEPLNIFREYGYDLVENQTIFFMQQRFPSFVYFYFELFFIFSVAFFVKYWKKHFAIGLLSIVFGIATFKIHRLMPFFGITVTILLYKFVAEQKLEQKYSKYLTSSAVILIIAGLLSRNMIFSPFSVTSGLGLFPRVQQSAEFFKTNQLQGPIFNNYDIGGYLIYKLFPKEKVFVDNRPEAYSVEFFKDLYIPMQENEEIWKKELAKNGFNTIYFYRHDATPWAQPFLIRRISDPEWVPVFVDDYSIILVRNNEKNKEVIEKYRIAKETFVVTH